MRLKPKLGSCLVRARFKFFFLRYFQIKGNIIKSFMSWLLSKPGELRREFGVHCLLACVYIGFRIRKNASCSYFWALFNNIYNISYIYTYVWLMPVLFGFQIEGTHNPTVMS